MGLPLASPTPDLSAIIEAAIEKALARVRVALPASIVAYDPTTQAAIVKVLVMDGDFVDGDRVARQIRPVPNVPVQFPGAGGYSLTWPLASGDTGMLICSSTSLARWLSGKGGTVDPVDDRRHHINDGIFVPGLRPFGAPIGTGSDGGIDPVSGGGSSMIAAVPAGKTLKLGDKDADDPVALKSDLQFLKEAILHAATAATDGGLAFKTNLYNALNGFPSGTPVWPVCSKKVEAK